MLRSENARSYSSRPPRQNLDPHPPWLPLRRSLAAAGDTSPPVSRQGKVTWRRNALRRPSDSTLQRQSIRR